jgi:bifunctional UDP-N-acetylglucosamine pyrophosphorylase/glucosamine-1-phosphate N-acetyltransferase
VGAGSVVTKDLSGDALAVTRAEQKELAEWAAKFRSRKQAEKAKKGS